jgi:hypothetical protein
MTETASKLCWAEKNQAFLVAQFDRMKRQLAGERKESAGDREQVQVARDSAPAIDRLGEIFGLSGFERDILLLCAGVEMDSELAARCGTAQGYPQRTYATFGLTMAALSEPHWSALTPTRPLRHFQLVELEPGHSLTSAPLRIDERILHYLAGVNLLDTRLDPILRLSHFPEWIAQEHKLLAADVVRFFESRSLDSSILHLCGDDPDGQEDIAGLAAHEMGQSLFVVRGEELPVPGPDLDRFITLWEREAALLPAALLIQCSQSGVTVSVRRVLERLPAPVAVASREPARLDRPIHRLDVNKPAPMEQRRLWERRLGAAALSFNGTLDALSEQFRLSAKTIYSTSMSIGLGQDASEPDHLWNLCRSLVRPRLEDLAQRIVPCAAWEDLVLPAFQMQMLRQLATQVHHRMKVYETWGFSAKGRRGLGVSALFAGESGTGKTMAAEVLARALALDLYRIDLSAVVSKYIGETEKNLRQVFDAAEEGGVLLVFDEADALFGKRSEVKDSHDRYANIEVSYLLQRMEAYQGLAILTTNSKSALDKAFQRRLRFTVNFPFPDATQREAIWKGIFPQKTPTLGLNNSRLAQLNVAGGNIRNIALNAAFLAAESNAPVQMVHVLQAARLEAQKIERPLSEAEIRGWV